MEPNDEILASPRCLLEWHDEEDTLFEEMIPTQPMIIIPLGGGPQH